jgi:uncharacterized paraquat-inducible protein A
MGLILSIYTVKDLKWDKKIKFGMDYVEFRTSCRYSRRGMNCTTFRQCANPKPWKRENIITRHGVVKCQTCQTFWNRDENNSCNIYLQRSEKNSSNFVSDTPLVSTKIKFTRGCEASTLKITVMR